MEINAVVTWFNPTKEEINNVNTYLKWIKKLFIIDNSKNNHLKDITYINKKICYIHKPENIGIASALNIGIKECITDNINWLLTMDQDTKMNDKVFTEVNEYVKNNNINDVAIITPFHNTLIKKSQKLETVNYPLDVMTSGNFVNINIAKKIGYFKEKLFIDGVDIEYCLRIKKNNYKIVQLNNVEIEHNLGNITYHKLLNKQYMCSNHNYIRHYYMTRNYLYIKNKYEYLEPSFCNKLVKKKLLIFKIIMFEKDKIKKIKSIIKGIVDYKRSKYGKM